MPRVIELPRFGDARGQLTVIEKCLPFDIKRVYWLSHFGGNKRGGHRHIKTHQAAVCIHGSVRFTIVKNHQEQMIVLNNSQQCLLLDPEDWHSLDQADDNTVVLMLASEHYDQNDYITEPL